MSSSQHTAVHIKGRFLQFVLSLLATLWFFDASLYYGSVFPFYLWTPKFNPFGQSYFYWLLKVNNYILYFRRNWWLHRYFENFILHVS